ncbi:MAG: hypothetical protein AAF998_10390 [Bacteroidota bacterium]
MKNASQSTTSHPRLRTVKTMFPLVEAKQTSDMNAKEFCAAHEVPEHVFYYWQRRHCAHIEDDGGLVQVEVDSVRSSFIWLNLGSWLCLVKAGPPATTERYRF